MTLSDLRTHHSTYIENLFTHRLLYDLARFLAVRSTPLLLTTLRSEIDDSGIDVVLKLASVTRFVQLKTKSNKTNGIYAVKRTLGGTPGGCVIWIHYNPLTLEPSSYSMFGGRANSLMQSLDDYPTTTKKGSKVRQGYVNIRFGQANYQHIDLDKLVDLLFW